MNRTCTPTELVQKLNEGGWFVKSGDYAGPLTERLPVVKAESSEGAVSLETPDHSFEVPCDEIVVMGSGGVIEIHAGKAPSASVVALRLTNPKAETAFGKERQEESARLREEDGRRQTERKQMFMDNLRTKLVGKKVVDLHFIGVIGTDGLRLELENGESLNIELGQDYDDAWIEVDGVSLRDIIW